MNQRAAKIHQLRQELRTLKKKYKVLRRRTDKPLLNFVTF